MLRRCRNYDLVEVMNNVSYEVGKRYLEWGVCLIVVELGEIERVVELLWWWRVNEDGFWGNLGFFVIFVVLVFFSFGSCMLGFVVFCCLVWLCFMMFGYVVKIFIFFNFICNI